MQQNIAIGKMACRPSFIGQIYPRATAGRFRGPRPAFRRSPAAKRPLRLRSFCHDSWISARSGLPWLCRRNLFHPPLALKFPLCLRRMGQRAMSPIRAPVKADVRQRHIQGCERRPPIRNGAILGSFYREDSGLMGVLRLSPTNLAYLFESKLDNPTSGAP